MRERIHTCERRSKDSVKVLIIIHLVNTAERSLDIHVVLERIRDLVSHLAENIGDVDISLKLME